MHKMEKDGDTNKKVNRFNYTPEQQERYMKALSAIYYRCLMGKATPQDLKIAEKFSPVLIERLRDQLPVKEAILSEAEEEEGEMKMRQMWERVATKLNMDQSLLPEEEYRFTDVDYRRAYETESMFLRSKSLLRVVYRYTAIAAMIMLLVGLGYFFSSKNDANRTLEISRGTMIAYESTTSAGLKKVHLPDGTQVELNRESSLKLSNTFGKKRREVEMKGQIFFDVSKDASKPFVINASGINVTVRGTSFEVVSYDEIPEREITVCTGRVEVRNSRNGQLLATLTKGMQLIFTPGTTGVSEINMVDADGVTAWRDGKLILHNASLSELRLRLRQYFGKSLVIEGGALKTDLRFSSSFNYEEATLNNVMMRLCALFNVRSRIDGNRIIVSPANNI